MAYACICHIFFVTLRSRSANGLQKTEPLCESEGAAITSAHPHRKQPAASVCVGGPGRKDDVQYTKEIKAH